MKSYRFPVLGGLIATVVLVASHQLLFAEILIHPAPFNAYYWQGAHDGNQIGSLQGNNDPITFTGGGDAGNWARNWFGRYQTESDSGCQSGCQPPVFMGLPPEDGDTIFFTDLLFPPSVSIARPFDISGGSISLPNSGVSFGMHANFSGGSYDVLGIGITTMGRYGDTVPINFNGTSFRASQSFGATAVHDTLTLTGATMNSPLIELSAGYTFGAPAPPPDGTPLVSIKSGSQVIGGVIKVSQGYTGPGVTPAPRINVSESILRGFGMAVGFGDGDAPVEVTLMNQSDAVFTQFLTVGQEGRGALALEGTSKMLSPAAYGIIGSEGPGFLHISDHSEVSLDTIQIGLNDEGDVAIDTTGKLITNDGILGEIAGKQGTANVETSGRWETDKLTVGKNGIGYLYVRDQGTVKIEEQAILGEHESGHGFLYLIGANSHLELAQGSSLTIGREGSGTLNIHAGAKAQSESDLLLGAQKKGIGTIDIDGAGSELHTKNKLFIGNGDAAPVGTGTNGSGTITVRNGGLIKADKDVVLGLNGGSQGVVNLYGPQSKLELAEAATLTIGKSGKGELNLYEGATFTSTGEVKLGELDGSDGTVRIDGENSHWNVQGKLTIGDKTRGHVEVVNKGKLTAPAEELDLGNEQNSNGKLVIDGDGTEVNVGSNLFIGQRGTGVVEIKNKGKLTVPGEGIFLGTQAEGDGTLTLDGDGTQLDFQGQLIVADFGKGKIALQNGADFTTGDLTLGNFASSTGTLEVKGIADSHTNLTNFTTTGKLVAGAGGKGEVTILAGGILTTQGEAIIGEGSGLGTTEEQSVVTIKDVTSKWSIGGDLTIGKHAKAALNLSDGAQLVVTGNLVTIGEFEGSEGKLSMQQNPQGLGPIFNFHEIVRVGKAGKGELSISGLDEFIHVNFGLLALGLDESGDGSVDVAGADTQLSTSGEISVGGEGKGKLEVKQLAQVSSGTAINIRGTSELKRATATVTGHQGTGDNAKHSLIESSLIAVGESGYGTLTVSSGGLVRGLNGGPLELRIGMESGHGKLDLTDGQVTTESLDVGGTSEINVSGASVVKAPTLNLGAINATGTIGFTLNGSSQLETHMLTALNGTTTTLSGATAKIVLDESGNFTLGGSADKTATLNVQAGAIEGPKATLSAGNKGKAIVNVTGAGSIQVQQIIVGHISSNVVGGSQFTATGNTTSTGANSITVHKGATLTAASGAQVAALNTATINGTVSVTGGSMPVGDFSEIPTVELGAVTVGPNGVLNGSGKIVGDLYGKFDGTVTGKRHPAVGAGTSPGILTVEGNVDLDAGTVLEMEIGGPTPGTQHDQIVATGSINVDALVNVAIVNSGGGFQLPSVGNQYTLLSAGGGVTANFENASSLYSVAGGSRVDWALSSTTNSSVLQASNITTLLDGDYNGDGAVDAADYVVWRHAAGGINLAADGNRDGVVDNLDFAVWRANFGQTTGSGLGANSNAAVPEPAAVLLMIIAAGWRLRRRRLHRTSQQLSTP